MLTRATGHGAFNPSIDVTPDRGRAADAVRTAEQPASGVAPRWRRTTRAKKIAIDRAPAAPDIDAADERRVVHRRKCQQARSRPCRSRDGWWWLRRRPNGGLCGDPRGVACAPRSAKEQEGLRWRDRGRATDVALVVEPSIRDARSVISRPSGGHVRSPI